jgi:hypothetical protein
MTATPSRPTLSARYRQHILAGILLAMAAYFGGEWLLERLIQGPLNDARDRRERLLQDIEKRESGLARIRAAGKLLAKWEDQSLPADTEVARSLYQAWLVELVDDVGLTSPSVTSSEPVARAGLYHTLTFSVRGRGTVEQLTKFLFAFYQTDLLHQLRSLTITPLQRAEELDLSFSIETMVLEQSSSPKDKKAASQTPESVFEEFRRRTWRVSDRLASDNLEAYNVIVRRNLFALGGGFDPTDHTYLTSIIEVNGEPEVWFTNRTTDEVVKLRTGARLELGPLSFRLAEVLGSDVIIEADGERWLLSLGDKLTDAHALPPGF